MIVLTPDARCLQCNKTINAIGGPGEEKPEPGSLIVCFGCGAVMLCADDLTPRGMSEEEMDELMADTETMNELAKAVQRVHIFRAEAN